MNMLSTYGQNQRKNSYKYVIRMCALFSLLILVRSITNMGFYAFAGISLLVFLASSSAHCVTFLLFLMPFATILKLSYNGMSIFTILFFFTIVKMLIEYRRIDARLVAILLIFFAYSVFFSGIDKLTTIITMITGVLMLYYIRNNKADVVMVIVAYSVGICLSSILALNKDMLPIISKFVRNSMMKLGDDQYSIRFSGLYGNPNYYTMDVIIALSAIVALLQYKKGATKLLYICFFALSIFGLMSVSKSFLISWIALILIWSLSSLRQGVGKFFGVLCILGIGAALIYYFAYDSIEAFLSRLEEDSSGSIDTITSGRYGIWTTYVKTIFSDYNILFFGNGLNTIITSLRKGTHNTYLEALFTLGILGLSIFLTALTISIGKVKIKGIVWVPVLVLMIRMFAIGIFTHDNLWFYLSIPLILAYDYQSVLTQRKATFRN